MNYNQELNVPTNDAKFMIGGLFGHLGSIFADEPIPYKQIVEKLKTYKAKYIGMAKPTLNE